MRAERWAALCRPRGIAIIGASGRAGPGNFAMRLTANNEKVGFGGQIYYVNPRYDSILGEPCYPNVAAIPGPVDVCMVNLSGTSVIQAVRESIEAGVAIFVVQSADFADGGAMGRERQDELREVCIKAGATLIGPNCLGYIQFAGAAALYGAVIPDGIRIGGVAALCGSGSVSVNFMRLGLEVGLHSVFSTGNEAVTTAEDVLEHLVEDPAVEVIAMFVETLRRPERFRELVARAHELDKPVVVLKSGVTKGGARAAQSHTGALVGGGETYAAFFEQIGVVQVADFDELRETVRLFVHLKGRRPKAAGIGLLSVSGGKATVAVDIAEGIGLDVPELSAGTLERLAELLSLPDGVASGNPVDLGVGFRGNLSLPETISGCMEAVAADPHIGTLVIPQNLGDDLAGPNPLERTVIDAVISAGAAVGVPVVLASDEGGRTSLNAVEAATKGDTVALRGLRPAFVAVAGFVRWYLTAPASVAMADTTFRTSRRAQALGRLQGHRGLLDPEETAWLFEQYDIPIARPKVIVRRSEIFEEEFPYPVVAKVVSAEVIHKSDIGGVVLGINTREDLEKAWDQIHDAVITARPDALIDGIQVAPMVSGIELFIGSRVDPELGPVVAVGLGGTLVELLDRPRLIVAPFDLSTARRALARMPGAPILEGFRGSARADRERLAQTLCAIADLTTDLSDCLESVDLNPVVVNTSSPGGIAVDARVTLMESAVETRTDAVLVSTVLAR